MPVRVTCTGCKTPLKVRDDMAGKKVKCPRCSRTLVVPSPQDEEFAPVEVVEERVTETPPARRKGAIRREDEEETRARNRRSTHVRGDRHEAPRRRHRDDEDEGDDGPKWKPCPRCRARGAKRVLWTPWGSFYGPALFHHVRCPDCGYAYNGRTGGSNLVPAIVLFTVPLLGILGIIGGLIYMLYIRGYF